MLLACAWHQLDAGAQASLIADRTSVRFSASGGVLVPFSAFILATRDESTAHKWPAPRGAGPHTRRRAFPFRITAVLSDPTGVPQIPSGLLYSCITAVAYTLGNKSLQLGCDPLPYTRY